MLLDGEEVASAEGCESGSATSPRVESESFRVVHSEELEVPWERVSVKQMPLGIVRTAEGFELHWGQNHMSNFVMTQLLMPLLHRGTPDARIVNVSSAWYKRGEINWDDPNFHQRKYSACEAYAQSKLANLLFTRELARRLEGTGVNA